MPLLILAGDRDYVTPVAWSEKVVEAFPKGNVVIIPKMGHVPDGLEGIECLGTLMAQFFTRPDVTALATSCVVAKMKPVPFAPRETAR